MCSENGPAAWMSNGCYSGIENPSPYYTFGDEITVGKNCGKTSKNNEEKIVGKRAKITSKNCGKTSKNNQEKIVGKRAGTDKILNSETLKKYKIYTDFEAKNKAPILNK
jgi:hypothetical protein